MFLITSSPIHTARATLDWLALQPLLIPLQWPTKGCDMNPIENLWGILVTELNLAKTEEGNRFHARDAANSNQLFDFVSRKWEEIKNDRTLIENLINSMPGRLQAVIDAEGGWTEY